MPAWTDEENFFITKSRGVLTYRQIGDLIGKSEAAVNRQACRLGIATSEQQWGDTKVQLARKLAADGKHLSEISEAIGLSQNSTRMMMRWHKIEWRRNKARYSRTNFSAAEVEKIISLSGCTADEIAAALGRSAQSIRRRIREIESRNPSIRFPRKRKR